jgi:endonuclease/exonuclease/phosphatase family metal-dependent hydrolase
MIFKTAFLTVIISSFIFAGHPITIDGLFDDWDEVDISYSDSQGDGADADFAVIKITYDNDFLFIYFNFHDGEYLMQDWNEFHLYIDADNDTTTGYYINGIGAELDWLFGDRSGSYYIMDGIIDIYQNDLTLRMAPTITNHEFEICISRNSNVLTMDGTQVLVEGKVILTDTGQNADQIPDENGGISFSIGEDYIMPPTPITFDKRDETDIRLVTHNVWSSSLLDSYYQEYFQRIYQALDPDIVALQEMYENTNQLHSLFNDWFPDEQWYVSSQFRDNIIISKYPVLEEDYFTSSERTMVALLNTEDDLGKNLIIFNSHLSCCGNNDSRQYDADEFVSHWRDWRENDNGPFALADSTPFIHVGDFNLVGYRQQLITLTEGDIDNENTFGNDYALDWDGSPIADLFSRHSHNRMGYTWRWDNSSFSPGKLDYVLYTDSVLDTSKHFVFNTLTMDSASLAEYGLEEMDSYNSSDHSPRVLDIKIANVVGIGESIVPTTINISAPYPNPFNPQTVIQIHLDKNTHLQVDVYDVNGRFIRQLANENFQSGIHEIAFINDGLSSGLYFIKIHNGAFHRTFKVLLLK